MANVLIIRGLPGSGKSTLAKKFVSLGYAWFEADHFFEVGGEYNFDPAKLTEAHQSCLDRSRAAISDGRDIVVSNTFTRAWEMQPYIDLSDEYVATLTVITCEGSHGSTHGVPDAVIEKMRDRWEPYKCTESAS